MSKELEQKIQTRASVEKVDDLEARLRKTENFCSYESFRNKTVKIIQDLYKTDEFCAKIKLIFSDSMKMENFTNKVKHISQEEVRDYIDRSRIKTIFWIIAIVIVAFVGMFIQKFANIF